MKRKITAVTMAGDPTVLHGSGAAFTNLAEIDIPRKLQEITWSQLPEFQHEIMQERLRRYIRKSRAGRLAVTSIYGYGKQPPTLAQTIRLVGQATQVPCVAVPSDMAFRVAKHWKNPRPITMAYAAAKHVADMDQREWAQLSEWTKSFLWSASRDL